MQEGVCHRFGNELCAYAVLCVCANVKVRIEHDVSSMCMGACAHACMCVGIHSVFFLHPCQVATVEMEGWKKG